jgi:hypothetical protein
MTFPIAVRRACLLALIAASPLAAQGGRLGTISFPNSGTKAAQRPFIRGVLLLHSFEYQDAATAFREAQRLDPHFALAYWGEAMTWTHPIWDQQNIDSALPCTRRAISSAGPTPPIRQLAPNQWSGGFENEAAGARS